MNVLIGIDLGGTQLRAALIGYDGTLLAHMREPSPAKDGPHATVGRIAALAAQMAEHAPDQATITAIGLGSPGPLDPQTGVVIGAPNMPGWNNVPLRAMVEAATGRRVVLGNDADAAALGEHRFGAGRGYRHLVYLTISTGIGGGVICDNRLLPGRHGIAGELGFMILAPETGTCWEDLASGPALARAAATLMPNRPESLLHHYATPATVSGADIARAAAAGDTTAQWLMEREARLLGAGIASLMQVFSPEIVLLGGSVIINNPDLLPRVSAHAYEMTRHPIYHDIPILLAALGEHVGLLGAAALVLSADEVR